jgi:hypothetical protein
MDGALSREDVYALEDACEAFVSLHRSEGFGLVIDECMYLGKPAVDEHPKRPLPLRGGPMLPPAAPVGSRPGLGGAGCGE